MNRGSKSNPVETTAIRATRDLDTLDIDGFVLRVSSVSNNNPNNPRLLHGGYYRNSTNTDSMGLMTEAPSNNMRYSRFGSANRAHDFANPSAPGLQTHYYFSVGDVTPASSMPTSGTARYSGFSSDSTWTQRRVNFDVDFGAKTVDGGVSSLLDDNGNDNGIVSFRLHGNINGSSFSGVRHQIENTTDSDAVMNMKGRFYGPNAEEMGGVYYGRDGTAGDQNISGAFGAKRN